MGRLKAWAQRLKAELVALWFCARHPRTPLFAKALAAALATYAFSPIDLIPDFIPVLGYLDELVILPAGIWLVLKLVPADVLAECRGEAARWLSDQRPRPGAVAVALIVVLIFVSWLTVLWLAWRWAESWLAY
jgi:uncharacterized membrane protein YkvA (DUF1232 family)